MYSVRFLILILFALALLDEYNGTNQNKKGYSKLPKLASSSSIREPKLSKLTSSSSITQPLLGKGTKMDSTAGNKSQKQDINAEPRTAKKTVTSSSSENSEPIMPETNDPSKAFELYERHGVDKSMKLCKSIDGMSSTIYGYGICKEVAKRLKLVKNDNYMMKIKCKWVQMNDKTYTHLSRMQLDKKTFRVPSLLMVQCKKESTVPLLFRLAHAKGNFYYVFSTEKKNPNVKAVLKIDPPKDNDQYYPMITKVEKVLTARDLRKVDNYFVHIGYASSDDDDHVCQKLAHGSLDGPKVCQKLLDEVIFGKAILTKPLVVCETKKVLRFDPGDKSFGWPKYTKNIPMAKCDYLYADEYYATMYFFNAAIKDYYFIAEPKDKRVAWIGKKEILYSDLKLSTLVKMKFND